MRKQRDAAQKRADDVEREREITPEEVRSTLNLYKAKLSLMSRSSKSSKREIKTALNACAQNTTGLFLKSAL